MAVPIRRQPVKANKMRPAQRLTPATVPDVFQLPTEAISEGGSIEEASWLIYGPKRIGKSSLAAAFPGALVFRFEQASRRVLCHRVVIPVETTVNGRKVLGWEIFVRQIDNLERQKHSFKVAVIDTGFEAYNRCLEYVCNKEGLEYPSEGKDRGVTWKKVGDEFRRQHHRLQAMGMGLVVVCHDKMLEVETRSGQKFDMVVPRLSSQADDLYRATIENVLYYHMRGEERWLAVRGSEYIFAGVSGDEDNPAFMTPNGTPIAAVPAGSSYRECFSNLEAAYKCEQTESYQEESEEFEEEAMKQSIKEKLLSKSKKK